MTGSGDTQVGTRVLAALADGPLDVLDLLARVRSDLGGREGMLHALLQAQLRRGEIETRGFSSRGLVRYAAGAEKRASGAGPDAASPDEPPVPNAPRLVRAAKRIASAARAAEDRSRISADVGAHLARLEKEGGLRRFGSLRGLQQVLRRVDRDRPTVLFARGFRDGLLRFLLHDGPWIVAAVLAFFLVRAFLAEVFVIPSSSMVPTLEIGDRVVVWKPGGKAMPKRFEIVTFERKGTTYVKRVAGLGGEAIALVGGDILANGKLVVKDDAVREALRFPYAAWDFAQDGGEWARTGTAPGAVTWTYAGPDLYSGGRPALPAAGFDVRLRDVYATLEADRPPGGEVVLGLSYVPPPDAGRAGETTFELSLTDEGAALRREGPEGESAPGPETGVPGPAPSGLVRISLSQVDGVVRASAAGRAWLFDHANVPLGLVVRPFVRVRGAGSRPDRLVLDKDIHWTYAGSYAVPAPGSDDPPESYAYHVPAGHVFCLGDNTYDSRDSRFPEMGPIATDELIGPVRFRIWPPSRIGTVR